jgi:YVTN family beta-propeller protein
MEGVMPPYAYITNSGDTTVSVIDTAQSIPQVVASPNVGGNPFGVALSPDGKSVYITVDQGKQAGYVAVLNTKTNQAAHAPINVGMNPRGIAVTPDGKQVCVANYGSNNVTIINTKDFSTTTVQNINHLQVFFSRPYGVAIRKIAFMGTRIYVTNSFSSTIVGVNLAHPEWGPLPILLPPQAPGDGPPAPLFSVPGAIAVTTQGFMYVSCPGLGFWSLDPNFPCVTLTSEQGSLSDATAQFPTGLYPQGVALSPDESRVYVAVSFVGILVIDAKKRTVVDKIDLSSDPNLGVIGLSVTPDGKHLYATNYFEKNVIVIKLSDKSHLTVPVGTNPVSLGQFI